MSAQGTGVTLHTNPGRVHLPNPIHDVLLDGQLRVSIQYSNKHDTGTALECCRLINARAQIIYTVDLLLASELSPSQLSGIA